MAAGISRQEFRAYAALIASSTLLQRAVERNLREQADLTQVQFEILMNLSNAGDAGIRMAQLADALIVSRSGLSYQVAQLESRRWITRKRFADDERGVVARITPEGERIRQRASRATSTSCAAPSSTPSSPASWPHSPPPSSASPGRLRSPGTK